MCDCSFAHWCSLPASDNGAAVSHSTLAQAHQLAMAQAQAAKERAAAKLAAAADKVRLGVIIKSQRVQQIIHNRQQFFLESSFGSHVDKPTRTYSD
jgi:hypothetical protein